MATISIHSLRVEGDVLRLSVRLKIADFNPLPPCGGRQGVDMKNKKESISIHSLRVEGDQMISAREANAMMISIHSLRVEGDKRAHQPAPQPTISIHSLRVEGDSKIAQLSA